MKPLNLEALRQFSSLPPLGGFGYKQSRKGPYIYDVGKEEEEGYDECKTILDFEGRGF